MAGAERPLALGEVGGEVSEATPPAAMPTTSAEDALNPAATYTMPTSEPLMQTHHLYICNKLGLVIKEIDRDIYIYIYIYIYICIFIYISLYI